MVLPVFVFRAGLSEASRLPADVAKFVVVVMPCCREGEGLLCLLIVVVNLGIFKEGHG